MLQLNVIKEVVEPTDCVRPMVVIPKADGSVRIYVDYTKLNQALKRERFELTLAEKIFAKVRGAKFFTVLNAASGFWQIPITQDSDCATSITPLGRYQFTRLPFGISSRSKVFHRAMQNVLQDLDGVDCFIHDVIIWGATAEEHDMRLRQVLDRFRSNWVRLQPSKCKFCRSEVHDYGHLLNGSGVIANENRVKSYPGDETAWKL